MGDTRRTATPAPPGGGWTAGATAGLKVRDDHVNELKTAITEELSQRLVGYSFSWTTVTAEVTKVRAAHINELRAACEAAATSTWCATDSVADPTWTNDAGDPPAAEARVTAGSTLIRAEHITELRSYMESLSAACLCNCHGYCCNCNGYCACNCVGHCNCQSHWVW